MQPLYLSISFQKTQQHVKNDHKNAINKIQTVGYYGEQDLVASTHKWQGLNKGRKTV